MSIIIAIFKIILLFLQLVFIEWDWKLELVPLSDYDINQKGDLWRLSYSLESFHYLLNEFRNKLRYFMSKIEKKSTIK